MHTKTINLYKYNELSDKAKEVARTNYRQDDDFSFESECVIDYAKDMAFGIGVRIDKIYYSGFSSQGDGACFEGNYKYVAGGLSAIKQAAPKDVELHRIAKALQDAQSKNFYQLTASMKHRGHYYHSGCMSVDVDDNRDMYRDLGDYEDDVTQAMRDLADWIYSNLEKQYEFVNSDEMVEEMIIANEYDFDENGNMV